MTLHCSFSFNLCVPSNEPPFLHFGSGQDGSCNGLQHYAALGRDTVILLFLIFNGVFFFLAACHLYFLIMVL